MKLLYTLSIIVLININLLSQNVIIDKVIGNVGGEIILLSDIENQYIQLGEKGANDENLKCKIFEEQLFQKLLLNQAKLDSVTVTSNQIESELERRLRYFIGQIGSVEKLEKAFNKSIVEIKDELRKMVEEQLLTEQMQRKIVENINATPNEIKSYFNNLPKDSLPYINSEYTIAQILIKPKVTEKQKEFTKQKIEKLRDRVLTGESFENLAIMYSEDPGTSANGGELGLTQRGVLVPEFEAVLFNLEKNEVSEVIETEFGYHIVQLIERLGESANARHILIKPKISQENILKSKKLVDSLYLLIKDNKLSFEEVAKKYSDDDETKFNGGILINEATNSNEFDASHINQNVYSIIDNMTIGQISEPQGFTTETGDRVYKIIKLINKTEPHYANLKDDYKKIKEIVIANKNKTAIGKWIENQKNSTYIKINDDFKNCVFTYKWVN